VATRLTASSDVGSARLAKVAGLSFASDAVFGVAMVIALRHLARTGVLPMTAWGFRAFSGPFERLGQERFAALGSAFVGVCVLDAIAGIWLIQGRRRGAALGLSLTPVALVLAGGFALPFLLVPVPIRAMLVIAGRRGLR
jgi:hypothetical protein